MEFMKNIIFTSCILTVAITIAGSLKKGEKFRQQLNMIFSLVFSAGVMGSIIKTGMDFEIPEFGFYDYRAEYSEIENNADKTLKSEIELRTNAAVMDLLNENKISYEKIAVNIDIEEDGSININSIYYEGDDFKRAEKIINDYFKDVEVSSSE